MKKILIALLLAASLLLGGCTGKSTNQSSQEAQSTQSTETPAVLDDPNEDNAYESLDRRDADSIHNVVFSLHSLPYSVSISMPEEWELIEDGSEKASRIILRDGKEIGKLFLGEATDLDKWKSVATRNTDLPGFPVEEHIEKSGVGDSLAFRFRYYYAVEKESQKCPITLTVSYGEVSNGTAFRLLNHAAAKKITGGDRLGDLSELKDGRIAILGNSFIGTSQVGQILKEMLTNHGKSAKVTAISRGYATVKTYIEDSSLMNSIRNGSYDAIFLCGFYSASEASNLTAMKEACDASGTRLVLFPAHNENRTTITSASTKHLSLYLMDWKQEIDSLIAGGIDKWDFCINDQHSHSTPLAGYVGAHMIYRAIYNELPNLDGGCSYVSTSQIKQLLGDYLTTGITGDAPIYLD